VEQGLHFGLTAPRLQAQQAVGMATHFVVINGLANGVVG
jgi:hypothetical protein